MLNFERLVSLKMGTVVLSCAICFTGTVYGTQLTDIKHLRVPLGLYKQIQEMQKLRDKLTEPSTLSNPYEVLELVNSLVERGGHLLDPLLQSGKLLELSKAEEIFSNRSNKEGTRTKALEIWVLLLSQEKEDKGSLPKEKVKALLFRILDDKTEVEPVLIKALKLLHFLLIEGLYEEEIIEKCIELYTKAPSKKPYKEFKKEIIRTLRFVRKAYIKMIRFLVRVALDESDYKCCRDLAIDICKKWQTPIFKDEVEHCEGYDEEEIRQRRERLFEALRSGKDKKITAILNQRAGILGTETEIYYKKGCIKEGEKFPEEIVKCLKGFGKKAMLITCEGSKGLGNTDIVCKKLEQADFKVATIEGITTDDLYAEVVDEKIDEFKQRLPGFGKPDFVVGLGGGVAMDFAKSVAIAMGHDEKFSKFIPFKDFSKGYEKVVPENMLPIVLIPSNPCTSAEINRKIIIKSRNHDKTQEGLTAKDLPHPTLAIIDPVLGKTVPAKIFSQSMTDILSAAVEYVVYYGTKAGYQQTQGLVNQLTAIRFLVEALPLLEQYAQGDEEITYQISEYLFFAELLKGMGIANTLLPHRLSYPLTNRHGIPHNIAVGVGLFPWSEITSLEQESLFTLIGEIFYPEIGEFDTLTKAIQGCKGIRDFLDRVAAYWGYKWPDFDKLRESISEMTDDVLRSSLLKEDLLASRQDIREIIRTLYKDGIGRVKERKYLTFEALIDDPDSLLAGSSQGKVKDRIEITIPPGESLLETLHAEVKRRRIKKAYIEKASGNLSEVEFRNLKWFPLSGIITDKDRLFVYKENAKLEELNGHIFPDKDGKPVIHVHFLATPEGKDALGGHLTDKSIAGKGVKITLAVLDEDTPIVAGWNPKTGQDDVWFQKTDKVMLEEEGGIILARIKEGVNVLDGIKEVIERHNIQNGEIVWSIGALQQAVQMDGEEEINRPLELVSLRGKISRDGDGRPLIDPEFSVSTIESDEVIAVKGNLSQWTLTTGIKVVICIRENRVQVHVSAIDELKEIIKWAEEGRKEVISKLEEYILRVQAPGATDTDKILSWASMISLERIYSIRMNLPPIYVDVDGEKFKKIFDSLLEGYPTKKNLIENRQEIDIFSKALGEIRDYLEKEYRNEFKYPALCGPVSKRVYEILRKYKIETYVVKWADKPQQKPLCYFDHTFLLVKIAGLYFVLDPTAEQFERLDNNTILAISPVMFPVNQKPSIHPSLMEIDILAAKIQKNPIAYMIYNRTLAEFSPFEEAILFPMELDTSKVVHIQEQDKLNPAQKKVGTNI